MADELKPFSIVWIRYIDGSEPRVLANARMYFSDAFGYQYNYIVFLQQARTGDPALKRYQIRAIIARHVTHITRRNDRIQKVDNYRDLLAVKQKVFDQRKRPAGFFWQLAKCIAVHQRVGDSQQRRKLTLGFLRSKLNSFAAVVSEKVLGPNQLALEVIQQADVVGV